MVRTSSKKRELSRRSLSFEGLAFDDALADLLKVQPPDKGKGHASKPSRLTDRKRR
jgi:hypothetical protein